MEVVSRLGSVSGLSLGLGEVFLLSLGLGPGSWIAKMDAVTRSQAWHSSKVRSDLRRKNHGVALSEPNLTPKHHDRVRVRG